MKRNAEKQWEATIDVWPSGHRHWWWKIYRQFDPCIRVVNTEYCKTKAAAYEDARRVLKRLNLVEVKT